MSRVKNIVQVAQNFARQFLRATISAFKVGNPKLETEFVTTFDFTNRLGNHYFIKNENLAVISACHIELICHEQLLYTQNDYVYVTLRSECRASFISHWVHCTMAVSLSVKKWYASYNFHLLIFKEKNDFKISGHLWWNVLAIKTVILQKSSITDACEFLKSIHYHRQ